MSLLIIFKFYRKYAYWRHLIILSLTCHQIHSRQMLFQILFRYQTFKRFQIRSRTSLLPSLNNIVAYLPSNIFSFDQMRFKTIFWEQHLPRFLMRLNRILLPIELCLLLIKFRRRWRWNIRSSRVC